MATVGATIEMVDRLKPNKISAEEKYRWLSEIDGMIIREVIESHEDSPIIEPFTGYVAGRDDGKELIVPAPYDALYRWYLESQIDLANMEIGKYNNSRSMYNSAYLNFADWYNRTHMPKQVSGFVFTRRRKAVEKDALSS